MTGEKRPWWRSAGVVAGLLFLAGVVSLVGAFFRVVGPAATADVLQLASVPLLAAPLGLLLVERRARSRELRRRMPETVDVARARSVLADRVAEQWAHESRLRSLDLPVPMPVRWRLANRPETTGPVPAGEPPHPGGPTDRIDALAALFRSLRHRRMVVLGAPGTGKTTLAVRLVRHLLASRAADEPVPVLFSVTGWNLRRFPDLHDWLAVRLAQDYPELRDPALGADPPRALVADGHLLPVLDGLDDLPRQARVAVLALLDRSLRDGEPLILTSGTVATEGALSRAAVVEPEPLTPGEAADHLEACLPPAADPAWRQLVNELRRSPGSSPHLRALADTVSFPLGLWLLRTVAAAPDATPGRLLTGERLTTVEKVRAHLFDAVVPALVDAQPPDSSPDGPRRRSDRVRDWLALPAHHFGRTPADDGRTCGRDFTRWTLTHHPVRPAAFHLLRTAPPVLVLVALLRPLVQLGGLHAQSSMVLCFVVGVALQVGYGKWLRTPVTGDPADPPAPSPHPFPDLLAVRAPVTVVLGTGLVGGILLWLPLWFFLRAPLAALTAGFGLCVGIGALFGAVISVETLFRGPRFWLFHLLSTRLPPRRRTLPLRLPEFFDDAHRLGLLRRVGPVYQFRHADLQDHLARCHAPAVSLASRIP